MARFTLLASIASLAAMTAAMGANYMPDHDAEQARLMSRSNLHADGVQRSHARHARRSATGSRRSKRGTCKSKKSTGGSTGGSNDYSGSGTSSAASSTSTGTVGGSSGSDGTVSDSTLQSLISSTGITGFLNENGPAIGSWFNTDSGSDSTNGMSWCQTHYQNDWPGFAPDVQTMLDNFNGDYTKAATAYCGLEAIVKTPSGASQTMYIVDGFDPKWVRTPGSIDIVHGAFAPLYGSETENKDDVIQGLTWTLTGNRKQEYSFRGGSN